MLGLSLYGRQLQPRAVCRCGSAEPRHGLCGPPPRRLAQSRSQRRGNRVSRPQSRPGCQPAGRQRGHGKNGPQKLGARNESLIAIVWVVWRHKMPTRSFCSRKPLPSSPLIDRRLAAPRPGAPGPSEVAIGCLRAVPGPGETPRQVVRFKKSGRCGMVPWVG